MEKKMKMFVVCGVLFAAMSLMADTETVDGYTWTYRINGDTAEINNDYGDAAISPKPTGAVTIPSALGGKPVTSIGDYAFYYCSGLTSVKIPNSVTDIGSCAFYYCSGLTSVTIPNSVTNIGEIAFSGCSGLTSIAIPNSVTKIGGSVFSGCRGLTSVTIPNSVTSIGDYAFYYCRGLTSVTIPDSVTSIGRYAFDGCSGLTSVMIGSGVTSIGDSAFCNCSGLTSIAIPNSVTNIGSRAFYYCSGLTSVTMPDRVTSIGDSAFYGCSGLTSVTIPDSVTSIGDSAFYGCSGLTNVAIGNNVTGIAGSAFSSTPFYYNLPDGLVVFGRVAYKMKGECPTSVTIPFGVTCIADYAFSGCSGLKSVTIPDAVTCIGDRAFENCSGLTSLVLPNSVSYVGYEAFRDCTSLMMVRLPLTFTYETTFSYDDYSSSHSSPFFGCQSIEIVEVHGRYNLYDLFPSAYGIKTIIVKNGETDMSADFGHCRVLENDYYWNNNICRTNLTAIAIPNSVTNIGSSLTGCAGLKKIKLPMNLKGLVSFSGCSNLEEIDIPEGVKELDSSAFNGCASLRRLSLPKSLNSIADGAFNGCRSIESITVAEGNPNFAVKDGCLASKSGTHLIVMPTSHGTVTIPDGIVFVERHALDCCKDMMRLVIPDSLKSISTGEFHDCTNLEAFVVSDTHPTYSTMDGVLMSKDRSSIVATPAKAKRVTIPAGMTVDAHTFDAYTDLSEIIVPDDNPNYKFSGGILLSKSDNSIVAIPKGATSITIPDFVTTLDGTFLAKCRLLEELSIPTNVTYISTDAFNDCPSLRRINLAAGSPIVFTDEYFTSNIGLEINVTGATSKTLPTPEVVNITDGTDPNTGEPKVLNFESIWDGSDFVLSDGCDPNGNWQGWWYSEDGWRLYSFLFMQDGYYYSSAESSDRVASIFNVRDDDGNLLEYGKDWYLVRTSGKYFTETYGYYTYNGGSGYGYHYIYNVDFAIVGCGEYSGSFNFSAKAQCRCEQPWYGMAFLSDGVEMARRNYYYYYSYPDGNEEWNCDSYNYYQKFGTSPEKDPFGYQIFGEYGYSNELQIVTYSGTPRIEAIYDLGNRDEYGSWRQCIENVDYMCVSSEPNTSSGSGEITTSVIFKNAGSYEIQLLFPAGPMNADYYYGYYGPMWFEERWETVHVSIAPQPTDKLTIGGNLSTVYTGEVIRPTYEWGLWSPECSRLYCDTSLVVTNAGTYHVGIGVEYNYDSSTYAHPNIDGDWVGLETWPWNEFMDSQDMPVNYTGLTSVAFTVLPRPVAAGQMSCSLPDNAIFDGNAKVLSNIVITNDYNGTTLQEGVDYDVSYSDNVNPGLATATITCKGNYSGTFTKTFTIAPASFDLTGGGGASGYGGGAGSVSGYEGEYDGEGHGLAIDVSAHGDVDVKFALAEDGPYVNRLLFTNVCDQTVWFELGAFGYSSFTGFAKVVISPRSITNATVTAENSVSAPGGVPQLSYSLADVALGKTLVEGVDYTAVVENNETEGVTTIALTGIGNYEGETQTTTLLQRSIADFGFELSATEYFYDSTQKRPAVTVTDPVTHDVLEAGRDYTVAYFDNARVGTARVIVTGIGAYTGSKALTFNIAYRALAQEDQNLLWQYWHGNGEVKLVGVAPYDELSWPSIIVVPDEIDGLPVREIPDGFFRGYSTVETIVVGANVAKCGNGVFSGCASLKHVIFTGVAPSVHQYWNSSGNVEEFVSVFTGAPSGLNVVATRKNGGWASSWPSGEEARPVVLAPTVGITPFSGKKSGRVAVTITNDGDISGAEVRYTTDGSEPVADSALYERRFTINVTELVSVKAAVFLGGVRISDVAETRYSPVLNDVLDIGNIIAKPGSAPLFFDLDSRNQWWSDEDETSFDGTPSMKSGKIGNEGESWMSASFTGAGVLEFSWKTSCEEDELGEFYYDHAVCELDGVEVAWLDGVTDGWVREEIQVAAAGEHTVKWIYVKDDADDKAYPGADCAWVDGVKFSYPVHVSFAAGDGTGEPPQPMMSAIGYEVTLPGEGDMACAKHRFAGWSDGERTYGPGESYTVGAADVTLTAVWEPKVLNAPVIEVAEAYDEESTAVTIDADSGATIYYTTDGSVPSVENGIRYEGAFQVAGTTTIKAIAIAEDWFDSDVSVAATTRSWSTLEECLGAEGFVLATGGGANWIGDAAEGCVKTAAYAGGWLTATFAGPGVATYLIREGAGEWERRDEAFPDGGEHVLRWEGESIMIKCLELLPVVSVSFAGGDDVAGGMPATMYTAEGRTILMPGGADISRPRHEFAGWCADEEVLRGGDEYVVGETDVVFTAVWAEKRLAAPLIDAPHVYEAESATVTITAEACASIYYTTDGTEPSAGGLGSILYQGAFSVAGSAMVKAIAVGDDYFDSEVVSFALSRLPWTLGECLNWPDHDFTTGGDAGWERVKGASADGYALKSGVVGNKMSSRLETAVYGEGTISFMLKVSSEADGETGEAYDGLVFSVDGEDVTGVVGGEIDWRRMSFHVAGEGTHVLEWRYEKDKRDSDGSDCAWLDEVTWTAMGSVPHVAVLPDKGDVVDAGGRYVVTAKGDAVLAEGDFTFGSIAKEAYKLDIAADGKSATVTLAAPQVGVAAEESFEKDAEDATGLLAVVDEAQISAKPEPKDGETVGALPVKTYPGLYYQVGWGDDVGDITLGEKVQATGDSLYLGVIKQTGGKGFYKILVSER